MSFGCADPFACSIGRGGKPRPSHGRPCQQLLQGQTHALYFKRSFPGQTLSSYSESGKFNACGSHPLRLRRGSRLLQYDQSCLWPKIAFNERDSRPGHFSKRRSCFLLESFLRLAFPSFHRSSSQTALAFQGFSQFMTYNSWACFWFSRCVIRLRWGCVHPVASDCEAPQLPAWTSRS